MLDSLFHFYGSPALRLILPAVVLLATSSVAAQRPKSAPRRSSPQYPNIILITLDTTRADRMGFLGSKRGLTPNLDAMAKQGVVFTRAYSHVPLTTASHTTILTGTYPQFNHVNDFGVPLSAHLPYLPDLLHQRGYHTGAFVASLVLDPLDGTAPGFDRGFDVYDAGFHLRRHGADRYKTVERRAEVVVEHALRWLSQVPNGPFFLWVHLYDAHDPYDPPAPYKQRFAAQPYDGEIAYADACVGKLLDALRQHGLYDETMIAVMADHGESLGAHGENTHGVFLYDETLHVPLADQAAPESLGGTPQRNPRRTGGCCAHSACRCRPHASAGDAGAVAAGICASGAGCEGRRFARPPRLRRDRLSASRLWLERAAGTAQRKISCLSRHPSANSTTRRAIRQNFTTWREARRR